MNSVSKSINLNGNGTVYAYGGWRLTGARVVDRAGGWIGAGARWPATHCRLSPPRS